MRNQSALRLSLRHWLRQWGYGIIISCFLINVKLIAPEDGGVEVIEAAEGAASSDEIGFGFAAMLGRKLDLNGADCIVYAVIVELHATHAGEGIVL